MNHLRTLIVGLAVMMAACAGPAPPAVSPVAVAPPAPTRVSSARVTPPAQALPVSLGDGLASLPSYRATFALTATGSFQGAQPFQARMMMVDEQNRALDAQRIVYTYSDTLHLDEYSEQVRLGDSSFLVLNRPDGARCLAQPIRQSGRWQLIPFAYSDLGDLSDARYVGDETLSLPAGPVRARHYIVERSLLGEFPAGHADVWIAAEGGYVARMRAEASGPGPFQSGQLDGRLAAVYELDQTGSPLSIGPPAACTRDAPIMARAAEVTIAGNMTTFRVEASASEAAEFYVREMRARKWELTNKPDLAQPVISLTFQRGQQTASVLLAPASQGGAIQVMIILTPG